MKFKLDENVDQRLMSVFRDAGHEVSTVRLQGLAGSDDTAIWQHCTSEGYCLVTQDLDFGDPEQFLLAGSQGILVLRPGRQILSILRQIVQNAIDQVADMQLPGHLWIVEPDRIRIHLLPDED